MNEAATLAIVIDGLGIITVPQEKGTLAISLIQHFTPNWIQMIQQGQAEGKYLSALDYVDACLTNLAVQHTVVKCPVAYMTVMEGLEADSVASVEDQIPKNIPFPETPPMYDAAPEQPSAGDAPAVQAPEKSHTHEENPSAEDETEPKPEAGRDELPDPLMEPAPKEESLQVPEGQEEDEAAEAAETSDDLVTAGVNGSRGEEKTPWD